MYTTIKSALDQISAEDELVIKTKNAINGIIEKKNNDEILVHKRRSVFEMKKVVFAACAAFLVCGLSIGGYAYYKTPVAYLSLDINPSVELGVNAFDKVVSATAYNADGETILEGQDVLNTSVEDAVNNLVESASENGFIDSDGSTIVSVTSETDDADLASTIEEDAQQGAENAIESSGDTAVVYKDNVALLRRNEARELGITPGKLNLIQKLQALDSAITVDQYKDAKVKEIMKKIIELRSSDSTDSSDSDLQNIESAVKQSEKNNVEVEEKNSISDDNESQDETAISESKNSDKVNGIKENKNVKSSSTPTINTDKSQKENQNAKPSSTPAINTDKSQKEDKGQQANDDNKPQKEDHDQQASDDNKTKSDNSKAESNNSGNNKSSNGKK